MKSSTRIILIILVIALLPVIAGLQKTIDPQRVQFQPGKGISAVKVDVGNNPVVLPSQFVVGTLIGLREVVAGLLWVRADEFFHSGDYEAIIPLVRIITWLDPHQIDVYSTGSWHLAYNFVDSHQRADHRYMAPAIKLIEEGIENNPTTHDLYTDLGFTIYFLKTQEFDKSVVWLKRSVGHKPPNYVYHLLAHAYEKEGKIDDALQVWKENLKNEEAALKKNPKNFGMVSNVAVSKKNIARIIARKARTLENSRNPLNVGFEAQFEKLGIRVFKISGKANLPDATRIDIILQDEDYKEPVLKTFNWQVDPNVTTLVETGLHGIYVKNGKFERKYDLNTDMKQYPFKKDSYTLTLEFNPRSTFDAVQERVGWSGEGLADKHYLDISVKGLRKIKKVIHLTRKDII